MRPARFVRRKRLDVDMDDAQPVAGLVAGGAVFENLLDAVLSVPHDDDRMGDQQRLARRLGYFAENGVEKERHVVVDDRDHRDRPSVADDAGVAVDRDDAVALPMSGDGFAGECGGALQDGRFIGRHILGGRARKQDIEQFAHSGSLGRQGQVRPILFHAVNGFCVRHRVPPPNFSAS